MERSGWGEIYTELGARPIINAIGSMTLLGGSTPPPEVRAAMEAANSAYIPMEELEARAGEVIARAVGVPAAYVTSGAGSALTLATAALMAGDDPAKVEQLPDTAGMKDEILIQTRQRYWYDRCLQFAGAKLVDFGSAERTTAQDLERAIGPRTVAVHYLEKREAIDSDALTLEATLKVASAAGVPVMVDSAGQIYPLENLGGAVRKGAVFQCVAAKYMGAPQSTGFAFGTEEMIHNISFQSFAGYEGKRVRGIGRPHKVDRQEIVGAVAAVKRWVTMNHEERLAEGERKSQAMVGALQGLPGVDAVFVDNVIGHHAFGLTIAIEPTTAKLTAGELVARLKDGDPPVWTRVRDGDTDLIRISPFGLRDGEEELVAERISELLS